MLILAFHGGQVAMQAADGLGFPFRFLITGPSLCVVEWKRLPPRRGCRIFGWGAVSHPPLTQWANYCRASGALD